MAIYLDNSATTKQYKEVTAEMVKAMEEFYGNPSSLHGLGMDAEKHVRAARKAVAASMGGKEDEIYFTSGGTEGDNAVIFGACQARKRQGNKIITSKVEHPAVLEACKKMEEEDFQVAYIDVDDKCHLNMEQLKNEIDDNTILISIMTVNNETGTIMPIKEISRIKGKALLHTDAVQGLGKVSLKNLGADFITVSGHKIHGPKGIGAMYVKKGVNLPAFIVGGGQEKHQRSGTENVPAIVGFGKACEIAMGGFGKACEIAMGGASKAGDSSMDGFDRVNEEMRGVRNYLRDGLKAEIDDIIINSPDDGASSVLNVSFLGTRGEVILHTLEQDGIYVSTGSACSSNKKKAGSHVLEAMGLSFKEIEGAIRFSFCRFNTKEEMDFVIEKTAAAVKKFRKLGTYR